MGGHQFVRIPVYEDVSMGRHLFVRTHLWEDTSLLGHLFMRTPVIRTSMGRHLL